VAISRQNRQRVVGVKNTIFLRPPTRKIPTLSISQLSTCIYVDTMYWPGSKPLQSRTKCSCSSRLRCPSELKSEPQKNWQPITSPRLNPSVEAHDFLMPPIHLYLTTWERSGLDTLDEADQRPRKGQSWSGKGFPYYFFLAECHAASLRRDRAIHICANRGIV